MQIEIFMAPVRAARLSRTALPILSAALFLSGWSVAVPASAQGADCRRASGPVETAICTTPALGGLDRQIGRQYAALIAGLDTSTAQALRQDQRAFLSARDEAGADLTGDRLREELTDRLSQRAEFLASLQTGSVHNVVGRWRNLNGDINIIQWATGVLTFEAQSVDQPRHRWVCEADGGGEHTAVDQALFDINTDDGAKWSLSVKRQGAALIVEELHPRGDARAPYCGSSGTIAGTYFPAERLPDPSR